MHRNESSGVVTYTLAPALETYTCRLPDMHGHTCTRKPFGPYYSRAYLTDAIKDHLRTQHAHLIGVKHEEPGDKRIASASKGEKSGRGWRF